MHHRVMVQNPPVTLIYVSELNKKKTESCQCCDAAGAETICGAEMPNFGSNDPIHFEKRAIKMSSRLVIIVGPASH